MKRIAYQWLSGAILAGLMTSLLAAQQSGDSLADYARKKKNEKQSEPAPKRVYDNDNLPQSEHISVVGQQPAADAQADNTKPADNASAADANPSAPGQPNDGNQASPDKQGKTKIEVTTAETSEDRDKAATEWQKKIAEQKRQVGLLERELDVVQREYKMRAAAVYADVGYRLRNSAQWDKQDKDYKTQIEAKQKEVDAAKATLADLQDQARKAGVPTKARE
jgi:hypothetical protein